MYKNGSNLDSFLDVAILISLASIIYYLAYFHTRLVLSHAIKPVTDNQLKIYKSCLIDKLINYFKSSIRIKYFLDNLLKGS